MPASKITKHIPGCNDTWQATANGLLATEKDGEKDTSDAPYDSDVN